MPVAVDMKFTGATTDEYDQVMKLMELTPGGKAPAGALFHWCAKTGDGLHIVDVWETAEQFQKFADEQIGPFTQQVGITSQPEITITEIHNYVTAG